MRSLCTTGESSPLLTIVGESPHRAKKTQCSQDTHTVTTGQRLEWYVYMPRTAVGCLQPPGARKRQGNILPLSRHGQHGSANSILDFCFPKCETVNCRCFKSGRLQWFVKAVLSVLVNDEGASLPCGSSHFCTWTVFQPPLLWKREELGTVLQ